MAVANALLHFALLVLSSTVLAFPATRLHSIKMLIFVLYAVVGSLTIYRVWRNGWLGLAPRELHAKAKTTALEALAAMVGTIAIVALIAN